MPGTVNEFGSALRGCLGMLLLGWRVSAARCGLSGALVLIAKLSAQSALRDICGSVPIPVTEACCLLIRRNLCEFSPRSLK